MGGRGVAAVEAVHMNKSGEERTVLRGDGRDDHFPGDE